MCCFEIYIYIYIYISICIYIYTYRYVYIERERRGPSLDSCQVPPKRHKGIENPRNACMLTLLSGWADL